ncbi:ExbD/TolR family protein [Marinomonas mediterranea]|uniref:ExbD/TolR family protein n=1 Tax=Marinomonas mediterranea TaxID=119864 RepID=UPI0023490A7B|nr:biopolymer transporter ExbD [Marinomonas mediterranea]WCN07844.1 biopolymer transporter ExbD [Marinomonas mediterranea]WCN11938.1 biopolymer transporter ExbD [Marinomonas mediterranea]
MNIGKKFVEQRDAGGDDNMIPMINVVFLMLVFFMVAGQIKKSDPIKVQPPVSINEARAQTEPNVVIVVGEGKAYVNDTLFDAGQLQSYLESAFEESPDQEGFWVQIKADGDVSIESLKPIFTEIRRSGLTKVSIATQLNRSAQ